MKKIAIILIAATLAASLSACGNETAETLISSDTLIPSEEYYVDSTPTELCAAVNAALPVSSELSAPDPAYTMAVFEDVADHISAFSVLINASGMTQDEYGIIKVDSEENIEAVKASVRSYLDSKLAAFTGDYTPEEKPKLENASIKVFGNFVVYCTLSEEHTAIVFDAVEQTLLAKGESADTDAETVA